MKCMDISLIESYKTTKSIKFSVKHNVAGKIINLKYIPDFSGLGADEGVLSFGVKNNSMGFDVTTKMYNEIMYIEDAIKTYMTKNNYNLDIGCMSKYKSNKTQEDKISIWAEIIKSSDGKIFTKCYNTSNIIVNLLQCKNAMITRPSFVFKVSYNLERGTHRLKIVLSEICLIKEVNNNSLIPK